MTETEFRVKHSELIAYYQFIEFKLKAICADLLANEERGWIERLDDYETEPLGQMIHKIRTLQAKKQMSLFTQEDFDALDALRQSRNYWVHQCFHNVTFRRNGELKTTNNAIKLCSDLDNAIYWEERLSNIT